MAFRRSLTSRANLFYQHQQRLSVPILSHIDRHDNDDQSYKGSDYLRGGSFSGSRNLVGDRRFAIPAAFAPVFVRNMSTEVAEKAIEEAVAPVANEVAAAVLGIFPVDVFQYWMGHMHTSGFNWWISIAASTVLIRTLHLPFKIHQLKAVSKFTLIQDQLDEIEDEIESGDKSPVALALLEARKKNLLNEYGIKRFANWASIVTGGPVAFFFFYAILNMIKKVESFKVGGALWFTDLTTPDATCILPALTAFTYWMAMDCHRDPRFGQEFSKDATVIIAALAFPLAAFAPKVLQKQIESMDHFFSRRDRNQIPMPMNLGTNMICLFSTITFALMLCFFMIKAVLCYWIMSNLYGFSFAFLMRQREVRKMLGISDVKLPPYSFSQPLVLPYSMAEWFPAALVLAHI